MACNNRLCCNDLLNNFKSHRTFMKILILFALVMTCNDVVDATLLFSKVRRCENEEAVCYQISGRGAVSCFVKPAVSL